MEILIPATAAQACLPFQLETAMLPDILLVEDESFLVSLMLPTFQNLYQVTVANNAAQARAALASNAFAVVLLDLDLGEKITGLDLVPEILPTGARIIVVSARCTREAGIACLCNDVRGFVDKHDCADDLIPTIEKVLAGASVFSNKWLANLHRTTGIVLPPLNHTERQILDWLAIDPTISNPAIGVEIRKSASTIKGYVSLLLSKFEVDARHQLVAEAKRRGYLPNLNPAAPHSAPRAVRLVR